MKLVWRWVVRLSLALFIASLILTALYRFVPVYCTPLMAFRWIEDVSNPRAERVPRHWVPIESVSRSMLRALIVSEDGKFYEHWGVDLEAMVDAYKQNARRHKIRRGGSTITQQTAKNVFLWPHRSYVRKLFELYFTGLIELLWGKDRILEVYVNVIEFGKGVYGIDQAAHYYYGVSASRLSSWQAASLAAVIPSPRRSNLSNPSPYLARRINAIYSNM